ncbi:MAG: TonB C-terminal domain-containing protein [Myxococcales bacterium]|nr:TonB C-terminal domain-containing protein [Myxococcales bacterium]
MRSLPSLLVALALGAAPATADVTIVKGGPGGDPRALADGALAEASKAMAVCWRVPTKGAVRVAVTVAADGGVIARAVSKGAAAQCAAGILAVWTIPGGAWKGEVEIGAGAATTPDLASTIQHQLLAASAPIKACQARAPGKAGAAAIKMRIAPDGAIGDVAVTSKLGDALDACVARAVVAIKLAPTGAAGAVNYQLAIAFSGTATAPTPPPTGGSQPPPTGSTSGDLPPTQVQAGLVPVHKRIVTCVGTTSVAGKRAEVRFTIRADGTVKNIVLKDASGVAKLDGCVKEALSKAAFAKAAGETKVQVPMSW